jgi:hypothetical protein
VLVLSFSEGVVTLFLSTKERTKKTRFFFISRFSKRTENDYRGGSDQRRREGAEGKEDCQRGREGEGNPLFSPPSENFLSPPSTLSLAPKKNSQKSSSFFDISPLEFLPLIFVGLGCCRRSRDP